MKKINITLFILILSISLISCNKDKISTNNPKLDNSLDSIKNIYSYIEYKNFPITCNDSVIKINQCVVTFHPKVDSTFLKILITGKYNGNETKFFPEITIKALDSNSKVLFEKKSYVDNNINGKWIQYNILTNSFLNSQNPNFVTDIYLDLNEYKNEYKFKFSDIEKFEISKVEFDTYLTGMIESSPIRLDTLSIEENSITQKFTNVGLSNINFGDNLISFYMIDEKGIVFDSDYGDPIPLLNYSPNQKGNFVVKNVNYKNVNLKDVIIGFHATIDTTKTKSILNDKINEAFSKYQNFKTQKFKLYNSKSKI